MAVRTGVPRISPQISGSKSRKSASTVNPPDRVTASLPVVTTTSRSPMVALWSTVIFAVTCAASVTVTLLTVIPLPKLAVVWPSAKWGYAPVNATSNVGSPCCALIGEIAASVGSTNKTFGGRHGEQTERVHGEKPKVKVGSDRHGEHKRSVGSGA